ncbi:MAG TPA: response regulator [Anaerolineales bacterium]|nr:response regulator [Anaerolineales bacterium]HNA88043.1 response regulator [Anaerolineales bacterium]HNB36145.1 response regulator [Anaerolineales bacterium]
MESSPQGYLLVVEDIPDILTLLETTLKFKGYRVLTAHNGQEALDQIEKEKPLLVITDILMPRMDGFTLVHHLRIHPDTRNLPVIFLTATYVAPEDRSFALTIGATRFMEKPVDLEELLKHVVGLLGQASHEAIKPMDERDFYTEYRKRLMIKLEEKNSQISRGQGILQGVSEAEKESFTMYLSQAINDRKEIMRLLEKVNTTLAKKEEELKPGEA